MGSGGLGGGECHGVDGSLSSRPGSQEDDSRMTSEDRSCESNCLIDSAEIFQLQVCSVR